MYIKQEESVEQPPQWIIDNLNKLKAVGNMTIVNEDGVVKLCGVFVNEKTEITSNDAPE